MIEFQSLSPRAAHRVMALRRFYFRPEFIGLNQLELKRPALFVGNHTLYGLLDVPLMVEHLYVNHGLMLRSLGDRLHFSIPLWRDWLVRGGMVPGTPEMCDELMQAGESVLVFPGGGREVWRRKDEQYKLIWKKRVGFVRQAIKHGYDIIPFCSLGADECYTILTDANDVQNQPWLRSLLERAEERGLKDWIRGGDMIPPVSRGIGPTLLPRPQRFYFGFGSRIPTAHLMGSERDEVVLWSVRDQVASAIEKQVTEMKTLRQQDRPEGWSWLRRQLAPVAQE